MLLSYVGPGAGFAFLGSFLSLLAGFLLSMFSLLAWPFRMAWVMLRRRAGFQNASVKKVIFLGLDGLDPRLTERFMAEGKMPNLSRLKEQGSYSRLRTTFPALSPVAWSTFATGVNPAKHNIFDFLNRNMKSYVPELAAATVQSSTRVLKLGRLRIPLSAPRIELKRKSQPFWKLLGQQQIGSTIIRVPITFPPDKFRRPSALRDVHARPARHAGQLFAVHHARGRRPPSKAAAAIRCSASKADSKAHSKARKTSCWKMPAPCASRSASGSPGKRRSLEIQDASYPLEPGKYTPWVRLKFQSGARNQSAAASRASC